MTWAIRRMPRTECASSGRMFQYSEQKAVTFDFNNENSLKRSESESLLWADPHKTLPCVSQVNMLIGIVVFNKLMSRDGISDKSKKQRAG